MITHQGQPLLARTGTGTGNDRPAPEFPVRATHAHPAFVRNNVSGQVMVIGAGPTGLVCAIALARAGRRALVRAWHRNVGMRFHADFRRLENWSDEADLSTARDVIRFEVRASDTERNCGIHKGERMGREVRGKDYTKSESERAHRNREWGVRCEVPDGSLSLIFAEG
ncbi:putative uncharacterized protein [Novosphingobium sp. PP1Y]|nr:putative uncharacterized protein [Novosphingobium sp. PP1Y]